MGTQTDQFQITNAGTYTVGNYSNTDLNISTELDGAVETIKTLEDGVWKSWSKGAPEAFQGFLTLGKGRGYVMQTNAPTVINFNHTFGNGEYRYPHVNPNDVPIWSGKYNLLATPFVLNDFSGWTPRFKGDIFKSIQSGAWKSWTEGAPSAFQAFMQLQPQQAYVVHVTDVIDTVVVAEEERNGVAYPVGAEFSNNLAGGNNTEGIGYTDPNNLGPISFNSKAFDPSVPADIMFAAVSNTLIKIDFATEYSGDQFIITLSDETIWSGTFTSNPSSSNPTILTEFSGGGGEDSLYISFQSKPFNNNPKLEMNFIVDNKNGRIDFAPEYAGDTVRVFSNSIAYQGVFTEAGSNSPVVLNPVL